MIANHDTRLVWDENGTPPELHELLYALSEEYPIFNHSREKKIVGYVLPFRQRDNSDLKDNYGARRVRVKEHGKVLCHPMSGVIAITVKQLFNMLESINSSSFNIETMKRPQRRERVETHKHFW